MKTLKYFGISLALTLLGFTPPKAQHEDKEVGNPCMTTNTVFQGGEELTYVMYYNLQPLWVAAGEVTFKVFDEGDKYHFQAIGKTYKQHDWYFKVRDRYEAWVDKETLLPTYTIRDVSEGKYRLIEKASYDQNNKKATVWRDRKKGRGEEKTTHTTKTCVYDILSVMYHLRNIDFESKGIGASSPFTVFLDKEEYPLRMKYVGRDNQKKVKGMGRYKVTKYEPSLIAGSVFSEDANMTVYVSDDKNKIPVLIESPVSVGSVKAVLKSYKGLKYEFTAKVD